MMFRFFQENAEDQANVKDGLDIFHDFNDLYDKIYHIQTSLTLVEMAAYRREVITFTMNIGLYFQGRTDDLDTLFCSMNVLQNILDDYNFRMQKPEYQYQPMI